MGRAKLAKMQSFLAHLHKGHPQAKVKSNKVSIETPREMRKLIFGNVISRYGTDGQHGYNASSGTFKARYKGIYQFSVTLLCGACSNLHFELVRGTPGFGTKVLAVGKAKNSEIHHTHQVTIIVFAELSPNDPVYVQHYNGDIVIEDKDGDGFSFF